MIYVHLATGFEEIEALTIVDVLRRCGCDIQLVSVTGNGSVEGAHGITVESDVLFEDADYENCNMIVLPGGMPGTVNLLAHKGLCDMIGRFAREERYLAAICAAPMVLGQLGVLKGKKATIYPGMESELKGAEALSDRVVRDGAVITSKGPGTAMEFALELGGILCGRDVAEETRQGLLYDAV